MCPTRTATTRRVPGEARPDDGDVDPISRGSEEIPSPAERIGNQRNDVLALDQKEHEVVREVIADCDRNQGKGEVLRDLARRTDLPLPRHSSSRQSVCKRRGTAARTRQVRRSSQRSIRIRRGCGGVRRSHSPESSIPACSEGRHRGRWRAEGARKPSSTTRRFGCREDRHRTAARSIPVADRRALPSARSARRCRRRRRTLRHAASRCRGRTAPCRSRSGPNSRPRSTRYASARQESG